MATNLNVICPINQLSYGIVSLNLIRELVLQNVNVRVWPIGDRINDLSNEQVEYYKLKGCIKPGFAFDYNAPCLKIFHQFSLADSIGKGPRIGFPIFELDKFSELEKCHLNSVDKILVCSKWAQKIVQREIPSKDVVVIPLGVDLNIYNENVISERNSSCTVFLNIGKWEIRKGHDILLEAFCKTFGSADNVHLVMVSEDIFHADNNLQWESYYKNHKLGDKVTIVKRLPNEKSLADIISKSDCGVYPTRAEGWGLPILNSMACGKSIIATNYSGQTEFVSIRNSFLVDVDKYEEAYNPPWFIGGGNWAKISLDQICACMEYVHKTKQEGKLSPNIGGIETARRFSWANSVKLLIEGIFS